MAAPLGTTTGRRPRRPSPKASDHLPLVVVAARLGVKHGTLARCLSRHADQFETPVYGRIGSHPRKHRLLTAADVKRLTLAKLGQLKCSR